MARKPNPGQASLFPKGPDLGSYVAWITERLPEVDPAADPFSVFEGMEEELDAIERKAKNRGEALPDNWRIPAFHFWKKEKTDERGRKKYRLIGVPNIAMRVLHERFEVFVKETCKQMPSRWKRLTSFPSATAFKLGSNTLENIRRHKHHEYFYIVDLERAYDSLDTDRLILLLTAILDFPNQEEKLLEIEHSMKFGFYPDDGVIERLLAEPLFLRVRAFVNTFCRIPNGRGIVTGAPSSPYLFNLYCEFMLDQGLRFLAKKGDKKTTFSRYVDDLVFSDKQPLWSEFRREVRRRIGVAGFRVNHRKSKVLYSGQGAVDISGFRLDSSGRIIFPRKKRRTLQGMLRTYLHTGDGAIEKISGHVAYFRYYAMRNPPTVSDSHLLHLCREFDSAKDLTRR